MKLNIEDLKNITPVGKEIELEFEKGYSGEQSSIKVRVYPLTVQEKITIQKESDELNKLIKIKERTEAEDARLIELNDLLNVEYAFFTTSKSIEGITREFIKENFPKAWYQKLFTAALEAEGIKSSDIEKEKN